MTDPDYVAQENYSDMSSRQEEPKDKGKQGGACNRSCCLAPNAEWYNFGSLAWYCEECADMLNECNKNFKEAKQYPNSYICTKDPEIIAKYS